MARRLEEISDRQLLSELPEERLSLDDLVWLQRWILRTGYKYFVGESNAELWPAARQREIESPAGRLEAAALAGLLRIARACEDSAELASHRNTVVSRKDYRLYAARLALREVFEVEGRRSAPSPDRTARRREALEEAGLDLSAEQVDLVRQYEWRTGTYSPRPGGTRGGLTPNRAAGELIHRLFGRSPQSQTNASAAIRAPYGSKDLHRTGLSPRDLLYRHNAESGPEPTPAMLFQFVADTIFEAPRWLRDAINYGFEQAVSAGKWKVPAWPFLARKSMDPARLARFQPDETSLADLERQNRDPARPAPAP